MSDNVGRGEPYREPCGGWAAIKDFLFGCVNHFKREENGYPEFPDGWPRYINTTQIDKVTGEDVTDPPERVCPYQVPRCWNLFISPPECLNEAPTNEPNTYALANGSNAACDGSTPPASTVNYASCHKYGYKNVQARKMWHGRFGFDHLDSAIDSVKYLTKTVESTVGWVYLCGEEVKTVSAEVSYRTSVDQYTGEITSECSESVTGDPICESSACPGPDMTDAILERALFYVGVDKVNGSFTVDPDSITNSPCPPPLDAGTSYSGTITNTNTLIHIHIEINHDPETQNCVGELCVFTEALDVKIRLSSEYTAQQLSDDVDGLLALWRLDDDVVYPWRTDVLPGGIPPFSECPCSGPAYAPLVTYDEVGPRSPDSMCINSEGGTGEILGLPVHTKIGLPNHGGNDPYWDSLHANWEYVFIESLATFCWRHTSWGAFAPSWCPNATQWTEDFSYQVFHAGAWSAYNAPHILNGDGCDWPEEFLRDTLVKTKWAETLIFDWPSHNYARPCGDEDRNTVDPDSIDCDLTPDGVLRWPSAPCWCNNPSQSNAPAPAACSPNSDPTAVNPDNDVGKKGDWCLKTWFYDYRTYDAAPLPKPLAGALSEMVCSQQCSPITSCLNVATIMAPDCLIDELFGGYAVKQISQRQVDPLWKRPKIPCDDPDNPGELDPDAVVPYEECRHCADEICNNYIVRVNNEEINNREECEPAVDVFWEDELEVDPP